MQLMRRQQELWDPFREMQERFNRMLATWPGGNGEDETLSATGWAPSCDISESDKEYRVMAELPSVKKDDVHVTLDNGVLTIQGERREEKEDKDAKYHRRELSYGSFVRRFTMPDDADESNVDATFKDGMLSVKIGKSKQKQKSAKEIAVR